ncbi:MAG: hypothetical protein ACKVPJ_13640 [Chitinophagales bacterium]
MGIEFKKIKTLPEGYRLATKADLIRDGEVIPGVFHYYKDRSDYYHPGTSEKNESAGLVEMHIEHHKIFVKE